MTSASPTPTKQPLPDAKALTLQPSDIPNGYRPHATSIMVLDTQTAVSERLVSNAAAVSSGGVLSGYEYGWESSTGHLAVQSAVFVCNGVPGATFLYNAISDTFKQHMTLNGDSPHFADDTASFTQGSLHVVLLRQGRVVFAVETTSETPSNPSELAMVVYQRLTAYNTD